MGTKRKASIRWVLPEARDEKGNVFVVFQTIWNLSLRSEAFRDIVNALLPGENLKGRSLKELVSRAARLTIEHNDDGKQVYANVASVKPLKAKTKAPTLDPAQLTYFSLDPDEFSEAAFNALSDRDREKIQLKPMLPPIGASPQPRSSKTNCRTGETRLRRAEGDRRALYSNTVTSRYEHIRYRR